MRTPRNTTTRDQHRKIVSRDKPPCFWCGEPIAYDDVDHLDPLSFQIDHVTPLARGGSDTLDNIVASHRKCNRDKGDKLVYRPGITFVTERDWSTKH